MRIARIPAGTRRKGVTVIVVEFILILVTLITSVMVGGFVFGLFGNYIPPAEVAAQVSSCSSTGSSEVCQLTLSNVGARNVATTSGCTLSLAGSARPGNLTGGGTIPGGASLNKISCAVQGAQAEPGSRLVGSIPLSNGATVFFTGTAS